MISTPVRHRSRPVWQRPADPAVVAEQVPERRSVEQAHSLDGGGEALELPVRPHPGLMAVGPRIARSKPVVDDASRTEVLGQEQHRAVPVAVQGLGSEQPGFARTELVRRDIAGHVDLGDPGGEHGGSMHPGFIDTGQDRDGPTFRPAPAAEDK
jgi:hypothetical protein